MEQQDDNRQACLQAAIREVGGVLAGEGEGLKDVSEQFSRAMHAVVQVRNRVTEEVRASGAAGKSPHLDRINSVISMMSSVEYPLAGIHWPRIREVHDTLREIALAERLG